MRLRGWLFGAVAVGGTVAAALVAGCTSSGNSGGGGAGVGGSGPVVLDGGGDAAVPPDGAAACPKGCNYQTSAGCSGATSSCVPYPSDDGGAHPVCEGAGAGKSGAACTQWTDCATGYLCAAGACRKLCCGGDWTGCPSPSEHCFEEVVFQTDAGAEIHTGAMLCLPTGTCDPLVPSMGCAAGTACQIVDETGASACFAPGGAGEGEPCPLGAPTLPGAPAPQNCKGGYRCNGGVCTQLCKAVPGGGTPACATGLSCVHFTRDPAGVGECK